MNIVKKIIKKPGAFQRFTGITVSQFKIFVKKMRPLWKKTEKERLMRADRKNKIGGGRPYELDFFEAVFLVLTRYRLYLTQEVLSFLFRVDQSNISRLLAKVEPLIEEATDPYLKNALEELKKERKAVLNIERFCEKYPDLMKIISDATETRCQRPKKSNDERKMYFSGKKKAFTIKTQITTSKIGRILDVSKSYPGSIHDKSVMERENTIAKIPEEIAHFLDRGYQGIAKQYPNHYIISPIKRKKNQELSELAKETNSTISRQRIKVEHVIGSCKQFKICSGVFRGREGSFNRVFRNISALHNFKMTCVITT